MNERAVLNKQLNLEKGVFSSLSTLTLHKTPERKANSPIQPKNPKTRSPMRPRADQGGVSPLRTEQALESSKVSPVRTKRSEEFFRLQEENTKLQETVKRLSIQLSKEKKKGLALETQLKETLGQAKEFVSLKGNVERAQKTIDSLKHTQKELLERKEILSAEMIESKQQILNANVHIETMANVLLDVVDNILKPLLEFVEDYDKDLLGNLQAVIVEEFEKIVGDTKVDLKDQIQHAKMWSCNDSSQAHEKYEYIQNEDSVYENDSKHLTGFDNDILATEGLSKFSLNQEFEFSDKRVSNRDSIDRKFLHTYDKDLKMFEQKVFEKFDKPFLLTLDRNSKSSSENDFECQKLSQTYDRLPMNKSNRNIFNITDGKFNNKNNEILYHKNSSSGSIREGKIFKDKSEQLFCNTEAKSSYETDNEQFLLDEESAKDNLSDFSEPVASLANRHQVSFANDYALTLYSFEGEREGDLAFQRGEVIEVLEQHDSGWWIGRLGPQVGTFPYNYVQVL